MKIIIGSHNPVKIEAVRQAFQRYFPNDEIMASGEKAPSRISDQPMTQEETYQGAINRAKYCKENYEGDYFVGLEGGIAPFFDTEELGLIGWTVVLSKTSEIIGKAGGGMLMMPQGLCDLLKEHKELGDAADKFFNKNNTKQKQGTIGILTKGLIERTASFRSTTITALIPHIKAWEG